MLAEVPFVGLVAAFLPPRVFGKISLRERAEHLSPRPRPILPPAFGGIAARSDLLAHRIGTRTSCSQPNRRILPNGCAREPSRRPETKGPTLDSVGCDSKHQPRTSDIGYF